MRAPRAKVQSFGGKDISMVLDEVGCFEGAPHCMTEVPPQTWWFFEQFHTAFEHCARLCLSQHL